MEDTTGNTVRTYEIIISITAMVLFGVLFAVTELFRSPFIIFFALVFILFPYRKSPLVKIIYSLSIIIFILWLIYNISTLLIPFFIAFIIAYITDPLVVYLTKKRMKRWEASLLVVVSILLLFVLASVLVVPIIIEQFTEFIKTLPQSIEGFKVWVQSGLIPTLNSIGIPTQDLQAKLTGDLPGRLEAIFNAFIGGVSGLFTGISILLTSLINIILVPFLTFYISKDYNNLKRYVKHLIPETKRDKAVSMFRKIDNLMGKYLRGALLVATINGIIAGVGLYLIGVKYAALLGLIAGILDFIPYFGLLISLVLSVIIALLSGNPLVQAPLTVLLFMGQNLLETTYISPKFIGERVGLHPAVLILSLLIFEYFFGFLGLLIALPTVSIIMMFVNEYLEKRDPAFKRIHSE